ncbi:MAG: hypothetical protein HY681_06645 [Chloroflexi bacterium]|nr:hypothetical protein [Chloroflexota bacterium]
MQPKELADTLWQSLAADSRWDEISGAERVDDTTITVMPFEDEPLTIQVRQTMATKKYDVHLFTVVRVKLEGIEATSQRDAIEKAQQRFARERIGEALGLTRSISGVETEYAEEVVDYLVDEEGDPEYKRSRRYRPEELEHLEGQGKETNHETHS